MNMRASGWLYDCTIIDINGFSWTAFNCVYSMYTYLPSYTISRFVCEDGTIALIWFICRTRTLYANLCTLVRYSDYSIRVLRIRHADNCLNDSVDIYFFEIEILIAINKFVHLESIFTTITSTRNHLWWIVSN